MKLNNYYQTLTVKQKEKLKEKCSFAFYYEWLEQLEQVKMDYESRGILLTAIGFYAQTNGTKPLPAELAEKIDQNPLLQFVFATYMNTTERATKQWINLRSKRKTNKEEEDTSTESPPKCPTMPQNTEEGHDTIKPIESDFRAKNEAIEAYGYVMGINEEEGTLSLEEGDTYTFNSDENPNITDFIEKFVVISHNSKNEIINIEEDTPF